MGGWTQHTCLICQNVGQIEIGRNEDNGKEFIITCPYCEGRGELRVYRQFFSSPHNRLPW